MRYTLKFYSSKTRLTSIDSSAQVQTSPALILVDLDISNLDGFRFIRNIRQRQPTMHTPIVVISMSNSAEEVLRCYDQEASSFIYKVADFTEYAQVLSEVCTYCLNRNISPSYARRAVNSRTRLVSFLTFINNRYLIHYCHNNSNIIAIIDTPSHSVTNMPA